MRVHSKQLYEYLKQAGVLHDTPEAIAYAKRAYRKQYKREWKRQRQPGKEVRIIVTSQQHSLLKSAARKAELKPTSYAREAIVTACNDNAPMVTRDDLLSVLQLVSMAYIALLTGLPQRAAELLLQSEQLLLHLQQKNS